MDCLFCKNNGPYSTIEHIIPESLGNKHLVLNGQVCDACQAYLGKEIERYVLSRSPIGAWRVFSAIETKHRKRPSFSFRQPKRDKGCLPDQHIHNDDSISIELSEEGHLEFDVDNADVLNSIADGTKTDFRLVLSPKMLHMMARFFGKVGLEMLSRDHPDVVRCSRFDKMRRYIRFGEPTAFLWPVFHSSAGGPPTKTPCEIAVLESNVTDKESYTLSILVLGNEHWVTCLSDPYPSPEIRKSFPGVDLKLITY
ncbi:MAG: HNH endonuclease [Desulfobacterales bacterium]